MFRGIRSQSLGSGAMRSCAYRENDLGFYLHQSVQAMKVELSSDLVGTFPLR